MAEHSFTVFGLFDLGIIDGLGSGQVVLEIGLQTGASTINGSFLTGFNNVVAPPSTAREQVLVDDDDEFFQDRVGGLGTTDPTGQVLLRDIIINGNLLAGPETVALDNLGEPILDGDGNPVVGTIYNVGEGTISVTREDGTVETGTYALISQSALVNQSFAIASTIEINPGDTISFSGIDFASNDTLFSDLFIPCFVRGTLIETTSGEHAIEDLKVGDQLFTMDQGHQAIRWIGSRKVEPTDLRQCPNLLPIRIEAHAIGPGCPRRDLVVSPQHRILVRSPIAERMFSVGEVLVPAKKLLILPGVSILDCENEGVEYFHIMFDQHEIIWSEGAATESMLPGPEALKGLSKEGRAEIKAIFPEVFEPRFDPVPARLIPEKGRLMKTLVQRHCKNNKPIFQ